MKKCLIAITMAILFAVGAGTAMAADLQSIATGVNRLADQQGGPPDGCLQCANCYGWDFAACVVGFTPSCWTNCSVSSASKPKTGEPRSASVLASFVPKPLNASVAPWSKAAVPEVIKK